jgi:hypothetical protein
MAGKRKAVTQEDVKAALALEQSLFGDDDGGAAVQGLLLAEKGVSLLRRSMQHASSSTV